MDPISPDLVLGGVVLGSVLVGLLTLRSAPIRELHLTVDGERLSVRRAPWGVQVRRPGRSWSHVRLPHTDPDLQIRWPRRTGPGEIHWRGDTASGGSVTPTTLLMCGFFAAACTLLWGMLLAGVLGNVARLPVIALESGESSGSRLQTSGAFLAPAAPLIQCPLQIQDDQLTVKVAGRPFLMDLGAQSTVWWTDRLPFPPDRIGRFRGPFAASLRGFGTGERPVMAGFIASDLTVCGRPFPAQPVWVTPFSDVVRFDGLLGLSTLGSRIIELDLANLTLTLVEDLAELDHAWLDRPPLRLTDAMEVTFETTYAGRPVRVQLDTGAHKTSVSSRLQGTLPPVTGRTETLSIHGGSFGVQGESGIRPIVRLAPFCLDPAGQICVDEMLADVDIETVDINLGIDALWGRVIVVDLRGGRLWIGPDRHVPAAARASAAQRDWNDKLGDALRQHDAR